MAKVNETGDEQVDGAMKGSDVGCDRAVCALDARTSTHHVMIAH
ncbi:MAG: hypothetical protein AB3N20_10900 [Rhizobiaceae bacterium]